MSYSFDDTSYLLVYQANCLQNSELKPVEVLDNLNDELGTTGGGLATGDIGRVLTILSTSLEIQSGEQEVDQGFVSSSLQTLNNLGKVKICVHFLKQKIEYLTICSLKP